MDNHSAISFFRGMSVMQLESAYTDGCLCIRYTGDLDHHAARAAFRETEAFIDRFLPRRCILDFSGVSFMDSSGIGVIIGRTKKLKYFNDSSVSVCNMSDRVDKLLKCAGIYTIVHKL